VVNSLFNLLDPEEQERIRGDRWRRIGESAAKALDRAVARSADKGGIDFLALRASLVNGFIDTAIKTPEKALWATGSFLAATGEFVAAGKLLEAYKKSAGTQAHTLALQEELARKRSEARLAMRATKIDKKIQWVTVVLTEADRIRKAERGWPVSNEKLICAVMGTKSFKGLGELQPAKRSMRLEISAIPELNARDCQARIRAASTSGRKLSSTSTKKKRRTFS
jgi:hypothetical protein